MDQEWSSLNIKLCDKVYKTIEECNFKNMTPVQVLTRTI